MAAEQKKLEKDSEKHQTGPSKETRQLHNEAKVQHDVLPKEPAAVQGKKEELVQEKLGFEDPMATDLETEDAKAALSTKEPISEKQEKEVVEIFSTPAEIPTETPIGIPAE